MEGWLAVIFSGGIGVVLLGLGIPLANNRIPPNRWYGYRVSRHQFEHEEIWYAINEKGGKHLVFAGIASILYAGICVLYGGEVETQTVLNAIYLGLIVAFLAYEIYWSLRQARNMARQKGYL